MATPTMELVRPFDFSVLSGVHVLDENKESVDLGTLFSSTNGKGIIIFRRHFNCFVCSFQLSKLIQAGTELAQEGFPVVIIAPEGPGGIAQYRERYSIPEAVRILVDPKKAAYEKLSFTRQANVFYNLFFDRQTWARISEGMSQARAGGFTEARTSLRVVFADVQQQGGLLLTQTADGTGALFKQGLFGEVFPTLQEVRKLLLQPDEPTEPTEVNVDEQKAQE